jgi:hypothetical protein
MLGNGEELEPLKTFYGLYGRAVAWNSDYLLIDTNSLNSPYGYLGFIAIRISPLSDISIVHTFSESIYSEIPKYRRIVSSDSEFVGLGYNALSWWNASELKPTLIQRCTYSGYVTDVCFAHNNSDPIIWRPLIEDLSNSPDLGYPAVWRENPTILGDIFDIHTLSDHAVYYDSDELRPLIINRMKREYVSNRQLMWKDLDEHEEALYKFVHRYDSSQSPSSRRVLHLWKFDLQDMSIEDEILLDLPSEDRIGYGAGDIENGHYYIVSHNGITDVNLNTLGYSWTRISLPETLIDIKIIGDILVVLYSNCLVSYEMEPGTADYFNELSNITLSAQVMTAVNRSLYIANSTHITELSVEEYGFLEVSDSFYVPTSFCESMESGSSREGDHGDLIVDSFTGCICRAAGEYGFWIYKPAREEITNTTPYLERLRLNISKFAISFTIGLESTLAIGVVLYYRKKEQQDPDDSFPANP